MSQLSKELNKVVAAKQLLDNAIDSYRCAINVVKTFESPNPPLTKRPINIVRQQSQLTCKEAKSRVREIEKEYIKIRMEFIKFLLKYKEISMLTLLGILCIAVGIYVCMNSGRSLSLIYKECQVLKKQYLSALDELANRIEYVINHIPENEMEQIRFLKISDVIQNKENKVMLILKLYSLSDAVRIDKKETQKDIWFTYYPIKLFYFKYGKALKEIPELQKEIP